MPESPPATKETPPPRRPGGPLASRPLHFIWLVDGSGSMQAQGKIEALNAALRGAIPGLQQVARDEPQATIYLNAIRFGDDARWLTERLTPALEFEWTDVEPGGLTALGAALTMVGDALQPPLILNRALPPILTLITDGLPTDDFHAGMDHLLERPWGRRSMRLAVALGEDANTPEARKVLEAFVSKDAPPILCADRPGVLAHHLRWAAIMALKSVCAPEARRDPREAHAVPMLPLEDSDGAKW